MYKLIDALDGYFAAHPGLVRFFMELTAEQAVFATVIIVGVLAIGYKVFARWFNNLDLEVYDADWMDADRWEATR